MNTPAHSHNASIRVKRPQRPLPALPTIPDSDATIAFPPYLVRDNLLRPFQELESPPLSLLCKFHNVKRVYLEEGVPPPSRLDIPILREALEKPDPLFPTHVLAVYDQDTSSDPGALLPYSATTHSGSPLPPTPVMIPINAELWAHQLSSVLSLDMSSSPVDEVRRRSYSSITSSSSHATTDSSSPSQSRPRAVLSLPVHILHVPSAQSLPLLLLAALGVLPLNCVATALLPLPVLSELPSSPAILTQRLLMLFYPEQRADRHESSSSGRAKSSNHDRAEPRSRKSSRSAATHQIPPSPNQTLQVPPLPNISADNMQRYSTASTTSISSTSSQSPSSHTSIHSTISSESISALKDPATARDPDLRLMLLAQQNFGLWADSLALGVKDTNVTHLVELAWNVVSEARRLRFGVTLVADEYHIPGTPRRSRSRTPLPGSGVQ